MADDRARSAALRKWRATPGTAPDAVHGRSRAGAMFRLLAIMAVVAAVAVALMLYLRGLDEPVFRSIAVTEYTSPLFPCNSWAEQDSDALLRHFPNGRQAYDSQNHSMLGGELKNIMAAKKKEPLVVHVSAHAVYRDGRVEVLPGDAQPDSESKRLPLRSILEALRASESENKLLILDIVRPLADSRLGVLRDDIAALVHEEVSSNDDPHLQVLCSCSPGQVALATDGLRQSVFGYYVDQALSGAADGQNPGERRNDRVSVQELAEFVRQRVDRWAAERLTRQTPVLIGNGEDFEITRHSGAAEPSSPDAYPFADGWKTHATWLADGSYRRLPRQFRQLQAHLLRAEERWMGGVHGDRVRGELAEKIGQLEKQRKEVVEWMAQDNRTTEKLDPKALEALKAAIKKLETASQPKTKEEIITRAKLADEVQKARAELPPEIRSGPGLRSLEPVLLDLLAEDPNPAWVKVYFSQQLLAGLPQSSRPRGHALLARLSRLETDPDLWPAAAVRTAFRVARQADALANQEPWALPWLRASLQRATQARKTGEDLLFARSNWKEAFAKALTELEQAERDFQLAPTQIATLIFVRRTCDDALAFLPEYANYLLAHPGPPPLDLEKVWAEALDLSKSIDDQLIPSPTTDTKSNVESEINKLALQAETLRRLVARLKQPFEDSQLSDLLARCPAWDAEPTAEIEPGIYWQLKAVLRTPFPSPDSRAKLWDGLQRVDRLLQRRSDESPKSSMVPLVSFDTERTKWERWEIERGLLRVRLSFQLFTWGGLDGRELQKARGMFDRVERNPTDGQAWDALAQEVRRLWGQALAAEIKQTPDLRRKVSLSRVIYPLEPELADGAEKADRYPLAVLRKQQIDDAKTFFKQLVD